VSVDDYLSQNNNSLYSLEYDVVDILPSLNSYTQKKLNQNATVYIQLSITNAFIYKYFRTTLYIKHNI